MSKVAVRLTGTRRRILVALHDAPVEDPTGLAVQRLAERVGGWSLDALSALLVRMERHRLLERTVRGRRTYRLAITDLGRSIANLPAPPVGPGPSVPLNAMPDGPASTWGDTMSAPVPGPATPSSAAPARGMTARPTPGAWSSSEAPQPLTAGPRSAGGTPKRLTRPRVEVLRALLAGGPIDDPAGHATRILMGRIGRTDPSGTHMLITGMVQTGLVRRTLRGRRVVRLEAIPDGLSPRDLRLVWSTTAFPVTTTSASPTPPPAAPPAELEALRDELAATRAELARVRLQLEMFRAWAKRMPGLDGGDDDVPPRPAAGTRPPARTAVSAPGDGEVAVASRARCHFVHPASDSDPERRGERCQLQVWEGSGQWCWHHDPTPIRRRRAPVRRVTSAA